MVATDSTSPKTSRAPTRRPSSMAAANSPPACIPRAARLSYIFDKTTRSNGAAAAAAQSLGSQGAKAVCPVAMGAGVEGTTTRSPSISRVKFKRGRRCSSSSSTTAPGCSAAMIRRTRAASLALTCAVPTSNTRVSRGLRSATVVPVSSRSASLETVPLATARRAAWCRKACARSTVARRASCNAIGDAGAKARRSTPSNARAQARITPQVERFRHLLHLHMLKGWVRQPA
mmetsp:Transcript_99289/g.280299  ORF Transcript_99289/g.280299 Transcript_99289/m.280299 type:complete len:231 (-) Transcript_99289:22-714(-)